MDDGNRKSKKLMLVRQKNMQKWKEEDYRFYGDFLKEIPDAKAVSSSLTDEQYLITFAEKEWKRFRKLLHRTKKQLTDRKSP